jgi:hypothetical protein
MIRLSSEALTYANCSSRKCDLQCKQPPEARRTSKKSSPRITNRPRSTGRLNRFVGGVR